MLLALITDFPEHEVIREKTFVFLHTMVDCLGRALVEPARAMLPALLLHSRPKDVQDGQSSSLVFTLLICLTMIGSYVPSYSPPCILSPFCHLLKKSTIWTCTALPPTYPSQL